MKRLFGLLVAGAVVAFGGAFAEFWTLPYFERVPTYSQLGVQRAKAIEDRVDGEGPGFEGPFANKPNAESSRRSAEMQAAQEQIGGR